MKMQNKRLSIVGGTTKLHLDEMLGNLFYHTDPVHIPHSVTFFRLVPIDASWNRAARDQGSWSAQYLSFFISYANFQSKFLRAFHFKDLDAVLKHAKNVLDKELEGRVHQVRVRGHTIPLIVERVRACYAHNPEDASYLLTTPHRAKGMEFDTVWLADDFATFAEMQVCIRRIFMKTE